MKSIRTVIVVIFVFATFTNLYSSSEGPGVSSEEALTLLKEGNERYVENKSLYNNLSEERREDTFAHGQHPFATIIACSDSRVPVEHIFDVGIGDVFVIRIAGNVCDIDESGSIEYGVDHLSTPVLVILGHSKCGAVTAVATDAEVHGNIPPLVDNIIPAVEKTKKVEGDVVNDAFIERAVEENVWQSMRDLYTNSEAVRKLVTSGKLKVVGAVYHLDSGEVEWLNNPPSDLKAYLSQNAETNGYILSDFLPFIRIAIVLLLQIIMLLLFYKLFISRKNAIRKLRINVRIILANFGLLLTFIMGVMGLFPGSKAGDSILPLLLYILISLVLPVIFIFVYKNTLVNLIKSYLKHQQA